MDLPDFNFTTQGNLPYLNLPTQGENFQHIRSETRSAYKRRRAWRREEMRRKKARKMRPLIAREFPAVLPTTHDLGAMDILCKACGALHFFDEITTSTLGDRDRQFTACCRRGKVSVQLPRRLEIFEALLRGDHPKSREFLRNIRKYNGALAFASINVNVDHLPGRGPYTFRVSGLIYHNVGPAIPTESEPVFGQVYFFNPSELQEARQNTCQRFELSHGLLQLLEENIRQVNPFAKAYKQMREIYETEVQERRNQGLPERNITLVFDGPQHEGQHSRRFNIPTCNEIAAIIVGDQNEPFSPHAITIFLRGGGLKTISRLNPFGDAFVYPIFFPFGDKCWQPERRQGERNYPTMREFHAYLLHVRGDFNAILLGRDLLQQYVVDAWIKVEGNNLAFIKNNQKQLRVETYRGLSDFVAQSAAARGMAPGRIIVLPSTFPGSPRFMHQIYQDAMAICRRYGKPDLFITFTCNPQWPEIQDNLFPGQQPSDRPELIARVFRLKLKSLLHDILHHQALGGVVAHAYAIEFQKRGLPHAHILLILESSARPTTATDIDNIVVAEIPNQSENPTLHQRVLQFMIHGPCGVGDEPCMENGKCSKDFPKAFQEETEFREDMYPQYRRRAEGEAIIKGGKVIHNGWVVPYNPFLLMKYNAHINVEICTSVRSFKYIYKYVFKGHDSTNVRISEENGDSLEYNEINSYLNSRYVSAPEACWRLLAFEMYEKSHSIERLPIHLPNDQQIYFQEGEEEAALDRAQGRDTKLTAWLKLNATENSINANLCYHDIPTHYCWDDKHRRWRRRKKATKTIGRMYSVSPDNTELYALRILLIHTPGATSFDALKRLENGTTCLTFQEAAIQRQLFLDDSEADNTLTEAASWKMPQQLRQLFAMILIFNNPKSPIGLWDKFKQDLSDDYRRSNSANAENLAYDDINAILQEFNKSLDDFGIQRVQDVRPEDNTFTPSLGHNLWASLNDEQKAIAEEIMETIHKGEAKCFFIDGVGGTGKTYMYKALYQKCSEEHVPMLCVGSTGIAATLLPEGTTAHSRFRIPLLLERDSSLLLKDNSKASAIIKECKLIVWDEGPMMNKKAFEVVHVGLQRLMRRNELFGGKVVVIGGDFRQCPPVVRRGSEAQQVAASLKYSYLWSKMHVRKLLTNMRANPEETTFKQWLLCLGNGTLSTNQAGEVEIPLESMVQGDIIDDVFGAQIDPRDESLTHKVILAPLNEETIVLNNAIVSRIHAEGQTYKSIDEAVCEPGEDPTLFPTEFLHTLTPNGLPPHSITLKDGAIIMLLRNISVKRGLCNGTRLRVKQMQQHVLRCEVITGTHSGDVVFIPKITLEPTGEQVPFKFRRHQFPIRLAFAMTINKAQGQTFDKVGVVLMKSVFTHGQLYVAASRVRRQDAFRVKLPDQTNRTKNIVYKALLL